MISEREMPAQFGILLNDGDLLELILTVNLPASSSIFILWERLRFCYRWFPQF